jgi:hypothetical protein
MTYTVHSYKLLNVEENLDWMEAGLNLVDNGFLSLMFWRKAM